MLEKPEQLESKRQEYNMLRREIEDLTKSQMTLFNICLTAVTGILSLTIAEKIPLLTLANHIIIYFILSRYIVLRYKIMNLSAYMIVQLEPLIGIDWETRNHIKHHLTNNRASSFKDLLNRPNHIIWAALSLLSCFTYFLIAADEYNVYVIIFHAFSLILVLYQSRVLVDADYIRKNEISNWIRLSKIIATETKRIRSTEIYPFDIKTVESVSNSREKNKS